MHKVKLNKMHEDGNASDYRNYSTSLHMESGQGGYTAEPNAIRKRNNNTDIQQLVDQLNLMKLEPIMIDDVSSTSKVVKIVQHFQFDNNLQRTGRALMENATQTSKLFIPHEQNAVPTEKLQSSRHADTFEVRSNDLSGPILKTGARVHKIPSRRKSKLFEGQIITTKLKIFDHPKTKMMPGVNLKARRNGTPLMDAAKWRRIDRLNIQTIPKMVLSSSTLIQTDISMRSVMLKMQSSSWENILQSLHELIFIAPSISWNKFETEVRFVYRKLIDFFKSPRSAICSMACQSAGEIFKISRMTARPEFDDLVNVLLGKTSDKNIFIRKDANIALDKMVVFIPSFHVIRILSGKGPFHKNAMVRTATARLMVCICAILGVDNVFGTNSNSHSRQRILKTMAIFLTDRNQDTRRFGEQMLNILRNHKFFEDYFFKDMETSQKLQMLKLFQSLKQ